MKTVINIKVDKEIKTRAFEVAQSMSLPLSTIINAFLKKFIADQSVTFTAPLIPNKRLTKIWKQVEKDIESGRNLSPLFTNTSKMDKYLANL
ncbi:MAG: type II toxin-antitoxin system RelB/DinJ family antitoxin [Patescibacteria group bacterium]